MNGIPKLAKKQQHKSTAVTYEHIFNLNHKNTVSSPHPD